MNYRLLLAGTASIFIVAFVSYQIVPAWLQDEDIDNSVEEAAGNTPIESTMVDTQPPVTTTPTDETPLTPSGYTMMEVQLNASEDSCWTIVNGNVYDITPYLSRHPGGKSNIMKICGKDGTSLFEGQHGGQSRPESMLESFYIGPVI